MRYYFLAGFATSLLALPVLAQPAPTPSQPPPAHTVLTQTAPSPATPKVVEPAVIATPAVLSLIHISEPTRPY